MDVEGGQFAIWHIYNKSNPIQQNSNKVVRVETEHQVALLAPKESQAFKNSMNGVGKMTYRQSSIN